MHIKAGALLLRLMWCLNLQLFNQGINHGLQQGYGVRGQLAFLVKQAFNAADISFRLLHRLNIEEGEHLAKMVVSAESAD